MRIAIAVDLDTESPSQGKEIADKICDLISEQDFVDDVVWTDDIHKLVELIRGGTNE